MGLTDRQVKELVNRGWTDGTFYRYRVTSDGGLERARLLDLATLRPGTCDKGFDQLREGIPEVIWIRWR
mgnify:CR=1 FL=1